jgi:hypothetical protein
LIDKVVRQKARRGPIGIENSEVINLETETEFKRRNKHVFKLNNGQIAEDAAEDFAEGYVDENGVYHGIDQDEKLFKENERLLQRLTAATAKENGKLARPNPDGTHMGTNAGDQTAYTDIINISSNGQGASDGQSVS